MFTRRAIDLPEVLVHIAVYLSPADLALACRVSKSWFTLFITQLWRTIHPDQFTDGGLLPALPRYIAFVRELRCPRLLPLIDPGPGLCRLTAFTTPEIGKHNLQLISTLIKRNTDLRDIHIRCRLVKDTEYFLHLIDTLTQLQRLKSLDMDTHEISTTFIFLILNKLPGLKHLRLEESIKAPKWTLSKQPSPSRDLSSPRQLFKLKQLRVVCRHLPLEPIFEIVQSTPDLASLEIVGLDGDQQSDPGVLKKLAHTLHDSCPNLRDLLLDGEELSLHDLYYFLSLLDLDQRIRNTIPARDRWMPLRTLHFDNNSPFGSELLDLVLSGSEVLQDSLETLRIDNPIFTKSSSASVVEILTTFRKLRTLSLKKTACVVRLADLFDSVSLDGEEKVEKIKPWACKDLRMLNIWIEGVFWGWCPPGVVNEKDDYQQDPFYHYEFPLYDQLKAQLNSYSRLDQRQIRYTYL